MSEPDRIGDAASLRALAHPVRLNLLDALAGGGCLTATEAAEIVGESPANCSWHLRQLARHNFVREGPPGPGRRRPWRLAGPGFQWAEADEDPHTSTAARELSRMVLSRELEKFLAAMEASWDADDPWRDATFSNVAQLYLTTEEVEALRDAVNEALDPFVRRTAAGEPPAHAKLVRFVVWGAPDSARRAGRTDADSAPAEEGP